MEAGVMVAGLRAKDSESIGLFFRTYYDKVYPICAAILGKGADARDMTVDILVDFVENRVERLSSSNAMYAFLRQTAVRRSIRYRERAKKMSGLETDRYPSEESTPEDKAEINMLMPLLKQCLGSLSPKAQTTLRLKYTRKISNEQIGEIVGGSKSYIGRLLKQGEKSLRRCIEYKLKQQSAENKQRLSWGGPAASTLKAFNVGQLLSMRPCLVSDACCAPVRTAEATVDMSNTGRRAWLNSHLATCASCREALLHMCVTTNDARNAYGVGTRDGRKKQSRKHLFKYIAAAAVTLFALSIGYIAVAPRTVTRNTDSKLAVKGQTDGFHAAVKRGSSSFTLKPMGRLLENDRVGLFYSTQTAGYLSVFNLDSTGKAVLLHPAGGMKSEAMTVGRYIPLNDGAVVEEGAGCEWLIAVFSNDALWVQDISRELVSAARATENDSCHLSLTIPGARSVKVLPVVR